MRFAEPFAAILAVVLISLLMAFSVQAKTDTVYPKVAAFSTLHATVQKKAASVQKGNNQVVIPEAGTFYLKFKAPKTRTYLFTFQNLMPKGTDTYLVGHSYFLAKDTLDKKHVAMMKVKSQGGKTYVLTHANLLAYSGSKYLPARYAKMKLKAGQVVYIYCSLPASNLLLRIK